MKYFKSSLISIILHVAVALGIIFYGAIHGCRMKKQKIELVDFTIAVEPMAAEPEPPAPKETPKVKEEPAPKKDDIPLEEKKVEPKPKPKPKPPEKKPDPPKKQPIVKGTRVTKPPIQSNVKPKEKPMSDEEIKKWLGKKLPIKAGERTSLPQNELQLNYSLIKNALYDAWNQPPKTSAGYRPAEVEFSLGMGGRISNPRLTQSSGSAVHDQSAIDAVRNTPSIPGLSLDFIQQNKTIIIEFRVE